ncbi:MAG: Holliday junction branch migration protein RuvA [Actinomycetes bacterium]
MIATLRGRVASINIDSAVIEVGGFGVSVHITPATSSSLHIGSEVTLATSLVVREDSLTLFGFINDDERSIFELLQTATGVGPRLAQAMLGVHSPNALRMAVATEDFKSLEMVPGIGRKGAQRIVLELKDRIGSPDMHATARTMGVVSAPWRTQVHAALLSLGFAAREAAEAIDVVTQEIASGEIDENETAALLKSALRSRDRG